MDVQEIVGQFLGSVAENPDQLKQFGVDPEGAVKEATGLTISDSQMKDVIAALAPMIQGKGLDMDAVMKCAGDFLGSNGGDILGALGGLFGGGSDNGDSAKESDGDSGNAVGELIGDLLGGGKKDSEKESGGENILGDIVGGLFGGK